MYFSRARRPPQVVVGVFHSCKKASSSRGHDVGHNKGGGGGWIIGERHKKTWLLNARLGLSGDSAWLESPGSAFLPAASFRVAQTVEMRNGSELRDVR